MRKLLFSAFLLAGLVASAQVRFGVAYYPEAWGRGEWEKDLRLMKETGIELVRIGEFNWGRFEPEEGVFDFSEYRDFLALCDKVGMRVIMCTPTAEAPKWMHRKYPETQKTREDGMHPEISMRQSYCATSGKYRFFASRIVRKMAEAFRDCPAIECWQLDNELHIVAATRLCVCAECTAGFRNWLKARYGTLENLNTAWNEAFWSSHFSCWEDIRPPFRGRAAWRRAYAQYQSDMYSSFVLGHRDILRAANPKWRITTNGSEMSGWIRLDNLYRDLGYAACDTYCGTESYQRASWMWNLSRSLAGGRKPWTVAETGAFNWSSDETDADEAIVPWFWSAMLHGAENYCFFRWRHSVMGEDDHPAILPWSGKPGVLHARVKRLIADYRTRGEGIDPMPPASPVAIIHDAAADQFELIRHDKIQFGPYEDHNMCLSEAIERLGIIPDIVPASDFGDLTKYRVVYLPYTEMPSPALREAIRAYVKNGGTAVAVLRLDCVDERSGQYYKAAYPNGLQDVFGLEINESRALDWKDEARELVEPKGCEVLSAFEGGCYKGSPLLTRHAFGKGQAFYRAFTVSKDEAMPFVKQTLVAGGVNVPEATPAGVGRFVRNGRVVTVNNTPLEQKLWDGTTLDPYAVRVVGEEEKTVK